MFRQMFDLFTIQRKIHPKNKVGVNCKSHGLKFGYFFIKASQPAMGLFPICTIFYYPPYLGSYSMIQWRIFRSKNLKETFLQNLCYFMNACVCGLCAPPTTLQKKLRFGCNSFLKCYIASYFFRVGKSGVGGGREEKS